MLRKKIRTLLKIIPNHLLYFISQFTKRRKNLWVFGSNQNGFNNNSKYFFIYMSENIKEIESVWIAGTESEVSEVEKIGFKALKRWSFKGIITCLKAKVYIISGRLTDVNYWTSANAVEVNLFHGVGLKKIGFSITEYPQNKAFNDKNIHTRIFNPELLSRPDFLLSTTPELSEKLHLKAFRVKMENMMHFGLPRNDHFFLSLNEQFNLIKKYENQTLVDLINKIRAFKKVFFYLPTFRDSQTDFIKESGIDFSIIDELMKEKEALFLYKFHPWTKLNLNQKSNFTNILEVGKTVDLQRIIPFTDVLITDYSSVYSDYLLLEKEIILFTFDYKDYTSKERSMAFRYEDFYKGKRINSFNELTDFIKQNDFNKTQKQEKHKAYIWGNYTGNASKSIAEYLMTKMGIKKTNDSL